MVRGGARWRLGGTGELTRCCLRRDGQGRNGLQGPVRMGEPVRPALPCASRNAELTPASRRNMTAVPGTRLSSRHQTNEELTEPTTQWMSSTSMGARTARPTRARTRRTSKPRSSRTTGPKSRPTSPRLCVALSLLLPEDLLTLSSQGHQWSITGHGFGGMVAQVASLDLGWRGLCRWTHNHGAARVFNTAAAEVYNSLFQGCVFLLFRGGEGS